MTTAGLLFPTHRANGDRVEVAWINTPTGIEIQTVRDGSGKFVEHDLSDHEREEIILDIEAQHALALEATEP